jgi:hypothetical protein
MLFLTGVKLRGFCLKIEKAQVSVEAIAAIALILILLVTVLWYSGIQKHTKNILEEIQLQKKDCMLIESAANFVSAHKNGNEVLIVLDNNAMVFGGNAFIGEQRCRIIGNVADATLLAGTIIVSDYNGVVYFENA